MKRLAPLVDLALGLNRTLGQVEDHNSTWTAASGLNATDDCAGWILLDTASLGSPQLSGGVLTLSTSADAEGLFYTQLV